MFEAVQPEVIVHCAAYTNVDEAEDNREICEKVNVQGTKNLVKYCKESESSLVYISTDYVFEGIGKMYQKPDQVRNPQNVYGQTKAAGEELVEKSLERYFIIRTSWVFGEGKGNFVDTMLRLGQKGRKLRVVNDEIGSPTYTKDLAVCIGALLETKKYGIYHITNEGVCSWYEFAEEIFRQSGLKVEICPVSGEQYGAKARRPKNSRLDKECLEQAGIGRLPDWKDALKRYIKEEKDK